MRNLAGTKDCDDYTHQELEQAGIEIRRFPISSGEVPSKLIGYLNGWIFTRAWRYWVAEANDTMLRFEFADGLHERYGNEVRVDGHCGAPAPRDWFDKPWHFGVMLYHVDTQGGLGALAEAIRQQARDSTLDTLGDS